MRPVFGRAARFFSAAMTVFTLLAGCNRTDSKPQSAAEGTQSVVLYTSVDQPFVEPLIAAFETASGIRVEVACDSEAGKTSGFLRRLRREAAAPRCDVWWSSEAFGTVELAGEGLFDAYASPAAGDIPAEWHDARNRWTAHAARPRVLAYNPQRINAQELPATWEDCGQERWRERLVIANPQFGTTRGHVAALFAYLGKPSGNALLRALQENRVLIADGNAQAARMVAQGEADLAWTDWDDVLAMQRQGSAIRHVRPRLSDELPELWIPCTVGLIHNSPHAEAARKLIDYLLSAEVELKLYESDSHNVPVRPALRATLGADVPAPMAPDFGRITSSLSAAAEAAQEALMR